MAPGRHSSAHWKAGKHVLQYLQGTKMMGITLGGTAPLRLTAYSDSAWADYLNNGKSSLGWIFTLGGGPISWRGRMSSTVARSSMEAELYAADDACQELVWVQQLLTELGQPDMVCDLHMDSQSALHLIKHEEFNGRARHIRTRYHFIRELEEDGALKTHFVASEDNLADIMTKSLPGPEHARQVSRILSCAPSPQEARGV